MNEAFIEFEKKINEFLDKYCFIINYRTGKKELTQFGFKFFIYLTICLYASKLKNEKEVNN